MQVNCFRTIIATTPEDLLPTVYLCTNQVAPSHEGIELGIGDATLVKVCCLETLPLLPKPCCWFAIFAPSCRYPCELQRAACSTVAAHWWCTAQALFEVHACPSCDTVNKLLMAS